MLVECSKLAKAAKVAREGSQCNMHDGKSDIELYSQDREGGGHAPGKGSATARAVPNAKTERIKICMAATVGITNVLVSNF